MEVSRVALNTIIASHPKKKERQIKRRMRISLMLASLFVECKQNAARRRRRRLRKKKELRIRVVPFTVIKKKMEERKATLIRLIMSKFENVPFILSALHWHCSTRGKIFRINHWVGEEKKKNCKQLFAARSV
jgi:hypothetical protein